MKKLLSFILLFSAPAFAQQWSGIISTSRATNWSSAGSPHINDTRTQCVTTACNTVSGGTVTATSVNSALSGAPANTYVLIPSGTFTLTAGVNFATTSNVTLRGSGSSSTFLVFTGSSNTSNCNSHDICAQSSDVNYEGGPTNTATWSAGYAQGTTSITLSSKTNLTVGNPIILDQIDSQSDSGALYVGCEQQDSSPACYSTTSAPGSPGAGPNGFERGTSSLSTIRGQQQIVTVTSIAGTGPYTIGISPGLYAPNWASGNSPGAWWATSPMLNDAVESMSIDTTNNGGTGNTGITWFNCQGCWVKGVRMVRSATTGTGWGHVTWHLCNKCEVKDSYFYGYSGDAYGVAVQEASDGLVENNIFHFFNPVSVPNSDCEGCVWGYNFQPGAFSGTANWNGAFQEMHGIDLFLLTEGNIGPGVYEDSFHGTHDLDTFFRNRLDGKEQNNGAATASNTVAVRFNPGTRYMNVIANVLGTISYHTTYKSPPSGSNLYTSVIGCGAYPEVGMTGDSLSCPTTLWWGNWDDVSNAVRWCGNSSDTGWSTTCGSTSEVPTSASGYPNSLPTVGDTGAGQSALPASFYYSSKPSWWPSGKAWPVIGPDVTGGNVGQCSGGTYDTSEATSSSQCTGGSFAALSTVTSIPAMDCYFTSGGNANGTSGPLTFNPSTCYTSLISTSISLSPSNFTPTAGTNITLTASVTPSTGPTGTVTFFDGGTSIGTSTLPTLTHTVTAITAGAHSYTAIYSGDGSYSTSTSSAANVSASGSTGSVVTTGTAFKGGVVIQ